MKRWHLLVALGVVVALLGAVLLGVFVYLPRYIEQRVIAEAKARGIELTPGPIAFGWQWVQVSDAKAKLIGAPSVELELGLMDFQLTGWKPGVVEVSNVRAGVSGTLQRVLFELGEWTKNHPEAYELPVVASRVSVKVNEAPALPAWLEVAGGFLTRTVAGAAFSAESCKLSGFELGKVGAGFSKSGSSISIGFGDQKAQAAPLRLDANMDDRGGKVSIVLTPTKLGLLSKGLGISLPLPDVTAAAEVELGFPPGGLGGEVRGKLSSSLRGFIPPHPPELDGFVFGEVTTLDTELGVSADRNRVNLTNTRVKAGKFELSGGGSVVREGQAAGIDVELKGALPCDALAGAAAESRLGQLLGRASGKQGKRTAQALVGGEVSVLVGVHARSNDLLHAKLIQKIGIGCGLKPLSLPELLALTPNAQDLQAIGNEMGHKLEDIGKNLGLPAVPPGLTLPALPELQAPQRKLAEPVTPPSAPAPSAGAR